MKTKYFATICITVIVLVILCAMTLLGITVAAVCRTIDDTVMNKSFNEFAIGDNFPKLESMTYDVENWFTKYSMDTHIYTKLPYSRHMQAYVADFSPQITASDNPPLNPDSLAKIDVGKVSVQTVFDITIEVAESSANTFAFVFTKDNADYTMILDSGVSYAWAKGTHLYVGKDLEYMVLPTGAKHYAISTKDFSVIDLNISSEAFDDDLHNGHSLDFHYYSDNSLYTFFFGVGQYSANNSILVTPRDYSITTQPFPAATRTEYFLTIPIHDGRITNFTIIEEV